MIMQRTLVVSRSGNTLAKLEKKLTKRLDKKFDRVNIYKDNYTQMLNVSVRQMDEKYFIEIYDIGENFMLETKQEMDKLPHDKTEYDALFKTIENIITS